MSTFRFIASISAFLLAVGVPLVASSATASSLTAPKTLVLADAAQVQQGKTLFEANCAVCHGASAQGKIGPNIVGKTQADIDHAIATVAMMQGVASVTEAQRASIAAYLQSLK